MPAIAATMRRPSISSKSSRDKRSDCVQVVIALIVTPEGFPLAYEVLPGNTADNTTLRGFLQKIEPGRQPRLCSEDLLTTILDP
jgi:transposase